MTGGETILRSRETTVVGFPNSLTDDFTLLPYAPAFDEILGSIQDISILDITHTPKECSKKLRGATEGKKCEIGSTAYYMKRIGNKTHWPSSSLEEYNRRFVRDNLIVRTPRTYFFFDDPHLYIGSKGIEGFKPACKDTYASDCRTKMMDRYKTMSRSDVAKISVAKFLFPDIHEENWGHDENGQLVIIDVDSVHHNHFSDGFVRAIAQSHNILCSMENLEDMLRIYQDMLTMLLPRYHELNGMSIALYQSMLQAYIDIWNSTIHFVKKRYSRFFTDPELRGDPGLNERIDSALSDTIRRRAFYS